MNTRYIVDTNSLLKLAQCYCPFDRNQVIYDWVKEQFDSRCWTLSAKVLDECRYVASREVVKIFDFLTKMSGTKFNDPVLSKQHREIANSWLSKYGRKEYDRSGYEPLRKRLMESEVADYEIIMLAKKRNLVIVTEENENEGNNNKLFKKIPSICKLPLTKVRCIHIVDLLQRSNIQINISSP